MKAAGCGEGRHETARQVAAGYDGRVSPPTADHRRFTWESGIFDTARRPYTETVEGVIQAPRHHLIMATLRGGARQHEFVTACGFRYRGPDRAGTVSFLPAGCERRLRLQGVAWKWASISLPPELFEGNAESYGPFTNLQDPFLFGLLWEMERLHALDGGLDAAYCETLSAAVAAYFARRHGGTQQPPAALAQLPPWCLRRIADYVDAHLGEEIRIAVLADLVGLSEGHLHRAFRATTGETPLRFVNRRRVERAMAILSREPVGVAELALRLGFVSPSHFSRVFRGVTGLNPSQFRRSL